MTQPLLPTRITKLWGIAHPIVGAPMAGRAGGELAAAVTRGGGLGMVGVGAKTQPEWIREQAAIARAAGPYGVGLMIWALEGEPAAAEQWETVLDLRPTVVCLSFGDPAPYVAEAHARGISVVTSVNTIGQARQAIEAGVDAICIQGTDAGGHTGRIGTMPLMQMILDFVELNAPAIPTLVAGGIGTGRGVAAALAAGADGAWVGTALLASPEATGGAELRALAVRESSANTVLTDIYDRAEQQRWDTQLWPTRTVRNAFVDTFAPRSASGTTSDAELIAARATGGEFADVPKLHAGQGIGMVRAELPAAEVVAKLAEDAAAQLRRASRFYGE